MGKKQSLLDEKIILIELHGTFYDVKNEIKECQLKYKNKSIQVSYIESFKMPYETDQSIELRMLAEISDKVSLANENRNVMDLALIINFNSFSSLIKKTNVFTNMYPVSYAIVENKITSANVLPKHVKEIIVDDDIQSAIEKILTKHLGSSTPEEDDAATDKDGL